MKLPTPKPLTYSLIRGLLSTMSRNDHFSVRTELAVGGKPYHYYSLKALEGKGFANIDRLPFSIKVLLEAAVRQFDGRAITNEHVKQIAGWADGRDDNKEIPFIPARIVLQDFTGVPVVVDLAAMRATMKRSGGDP
ncbi:MAG: aconitate hydratase, partial [Paenibacillus sp.]|nr:aconitate hydratase [Paenibacillus sp.]